MQQKTKYTVWGFAPVTMKFLIISLSYASHMLHSVTSFLTLAANCLKFMDSWFKPLSVSKLLYTIALGLVHWSRSRKSVTFQKLFSVSVPESCTSSFMFSSSQHGSVLAFIGSLLADNGASIMSSTSLMNCCTLLWCPSSSVQSMAGGEVNAVVMVVLVDSTCESLCIDNCLLI